MQNHFDLTSQLLAGRSNLQQELQKVQQQQQQKASINQVMLREAHKYVKDHGIPEGSIMNLAWKGNFVAFLAKTKSLSSEDLQREVNERDPEYGRTALHWACARGHSNITTMLTTMKANASLSDNKGWTPLHLAARAGNLKAVNTFLKNGVNADMVDNDGYTPLMTACYHGHVEIVKELIHDGSCMVNKTDSLGHTALHCTLMGAMKKAPGGNKKYANVVDDVVDILLRVKADPRTQTLAGVSVIDLAIAYDHTPILQNIVESMSKVLQNNSNAGVPTGMNQFLQQQLQQRNVGSHTNPFSNDEQINNMINNNSLDISNLLNNKNGIDLNDLLNNGNENDTFAGLQKNILEQLTGNLLQNTQAQSSNPDLSALLSMSGVSPDIILETAKNLGLAQENKLPPNGSSNQSARSTGPKGKANPKAVIKSLPNKGAQRSR